MKNITVVGTGYVGLVTGVCLAEVGNNVICLDIDKNKIASLQANKSPIYEDGLQELIIKNNNLGRTLYTTDVELAYKNPDIIFIGVGTPEMLDGSANLEYVYRAVDDIIARVENDCLVVIKSTVPIGTVDLISEYIQKKLKKDLHIEVASNPEFLAQGTAVKDTLQAQRIVIGTESKWAEERLMQIYEPFKIPIVSVNRRSAEMIKYASNDFLALKISYMNDIANLCELVGADIQDVAKGMSYDSRIGDKFLNAGIGYGGSCFPKDTKALEQIAKEKGYELKTVKAAIDVNSKQKTKLFEKAKKRLMTFSGLKVAVLGLTFKPGTDDLREAASLDNIALLLDAAADIYAFDPVGANNFMKIYPEGKHSNGSITYVENPEKALQDANVCFIFTEWDEVKVITPSEYKHLMRTSLIFDGRNIYKIQDMQAANVEYHSIGRQITALI